MKKLEPNFAMVSSAAGGGLASVIFCARDLACFASNEYYLYFLKYVKLNQMDQQFKVKFNSDPMQTTKSFIARMEKSDWVFIFSYITILMVVAMVVDFGFHLIDGKYLYLPGIFLGGPLLRNRIFNKTNGKSSMPFVHKFDLEVGNGEKHKVYFEYEKWTGGITVKSDGVDVARTRILVLGQSPILTVNVGDKEKHEVRFDIRPGGLFFLKPTILVYVDNKVVKTY